jgi:hypothetical protein
MGIVVVSRDDIFDFDCLTHLLQPRLLFKIDLLTHAACSITRLVLMIGHILQTADVLTHIAVSGWSFRSQLDVLLALQIDLSGCEWLFSRLVHDLDAAMADYSMVL